mmetsp:Transcript_54094/g.143126  ORF Transcript_54094/g.143126 Transcript_54094/m.143126 type:complete len:95 (+) Transcript_54094:427-711(+)
MICPGGIFPFQFSIPHHYSIQFSELTFDNEWRVSREHTGWDEEFISLRRVKAEREQKPMNNKLLNEAMRHISVCFALRVAKVAKVENPERKSPN